VPEPTASESCYAPEDMARPGFEPEMTVTGAACFLFLMHCCFLHCVVTTVQVTVQLNGDTTYRKDQLLIALLRAEVVESDHGFHLINLGKFNRVAK